MGKGLEDLVRAHGGLVTWREATKAGVTRHALEWARKAGRVHLIRRGVYTTKARWLAATLEERHILELLAHQRVNDHLVACETSAAIALGLPTPSGPPPRPQLTRARGTPPLAHGESPGGRGNRGGQTVRLSLLNEAEVWTLSNGLKVTSALRTVLDCSRGWDEPWGLAIADAALAKYSIEPEALVAAAFARHPGPGTRRTLWVAEHARAKVESPLESLARGVVVMAGLPEPTPQVWISTRLGSFRVDLLDETNRAIIEADGKVKYQSAGDLWREKRREDALRDTGFQMTRFAAADYHHSVPWLVGYRAALARGGKWQG